MREIVLLHDLLTHTSHISLQAFLNTIKAFSKISMCTKLYLETLEVFFLRLKGSTVTTLKGKYKRANAFQIKSSNPFLNVP